MAAEPVQKRSDFQNQPQKARKRLISSTFVLRWVVTTSSFTNPSICLTEMPQTFRRGSLLRLRQLTTRRGGKRRRYLGTGTRTAVGGSFHWGLKPTRGTSA